MGENQRKQSAEPKKILHFKRIEIGIMGRLIVIKHKIDNVCRRPYEQDLKSGVVKRIGKGRKQV